MWHAFEFDKNSSVEGVGKNVSGVLIAFEKHLAIDGESLLLISFHSGATLKNGYSCKGHLLKTKVSVNFVISNESYSVSNPVDNEILLIFFN